MTLNCQIKNVEEWKATVDAISVIVEDAMFIVNHDGISFRGTDPSHIALLDITFPKSSFEKFEATTSFFGIRIDDLKNVLNSAGNNDIIDLKVDDTSLQISISGSLKMDYRMSVLNKSDINYFSKIPANFFQLLSFSKNHKNFHTHVLRWGGG